MTDHNPIPSSNAPANPRAGAGSGACAGAGAAGNRARAGRPASGGGLLQIDLTDPDLPVTGRGALSAVRKSTRGTWRAAVLVLVHVLCVAHIAHYMLAGWSLSPVEPSESMYTLELGWVNAGFIFFTLAILSTLVFGRFFCGWGCHLVAMQDLCAWFMKKLGIRPRPFRSRLLLLVPVALGFYMFLWPTLRRLLFRIPPDRSPASPTTSSRPTTGGPSRGRCSRS